MPRFIERVPAEVTFDGEIILKIIEGDEEKEEMMKNIINKSLELIESDALGGSGSRGYGQVKISNKNWEII
jgi:CRISPR-associated protein Csm3